MKWKGEKSGCILGMVNWSMQKMGMVNWSIQKMVKMSGEIREKAGWGKFFREQSTLGDQEEGKYIKKSLTILI